MKAEEILEKLERTALAALAKRAQDGDTQAARALLGRVDKIRANNPKGRAPLNAREAAVQRVINGEPAASVAADIGKPPATVRSWVHRAKTTKPPKAPVEIEHVEAPRSHLEALRRQWSQVQENIAWCIEGGKASSLAGLQSLSARLDEKIWAIEEAQEFERRRLEEDSDPAEDISAMIEDLLTLPRHMVSDIVDRLSVGLE